MHSARELRWIVVGEAGQLHHVYKAFGQGAALAARYAAHSRVAGFREAFSAASLVPRPRLLRDRILTTEDAFRETMALMGLPEPPTAIFVAAMDMLGGCLRALRTLRCQVGRDVSLLAGSDSELAELYDPPVTAISWDLAAMGRHAASMLLDRMNSAERDSDRSLLLPTELVIRSSCQPLSIQSGFRPD
ncbi:MAG: hypothetical protein DI601_06225 [Azospirillum brasilense]|nr:MAG: hypothetical protein DI601_06225 [Azospirillum brasilense]